MVFLLLLFMTVKENEYFIARDHMGIIPLYQGWDNEGHYYVSSELKALEKDCPSLCEFLPGTYLSSKDKKVTTWYKREWQNYKSVKDSKKPTQNLLEIL